MESLTPSLTQIDNWAYTSLGSHSILSSALISYSFRSELFSFLDPGYCEVGNRRKAFIPPAFQVVFNLVGEINTHAHTNVN